MTVTSIIPLLVCLAGVLVYALASNPKVCEMGRLAYFAGLFVTLLAVAKHVVRLGAIVLVLALTSTAAADAGPVSVDVTDAGPLDAGPTPAVTVNAGSGSTVNVTPTPLPDPLDAPVASGTLLHKLYKTGHLIPMAIVLMFFGLTLAQRWVPWLKTGWRKLTVASVLGGLTMIAERAVNGETPNMSMVAGAIGVAWALWKNAEGEPKPTPAVPA